MCAMETLTLVTPDGARQTFGGGSPQATWIVRKPRTIRKILLNPGANLGETYMDEEWDVEDGDLIDLLTLLRTNAEPAVSDRRLIALTGPLATLVSSWNTARASLRNVSHHYNLDEALFRAFLDRDMHYSCAYFREAGMTLEAAQIAMSEHIRNKLRLVPGARVLDVGSGWGSLAMHLAEHADVDVVGLTLSSEQVRVASAEAERRGPVRAGGIQAGRLSPSSRPIRRRGVRGHVRTRRPAQFRTILRPGPRPAGAGRQSH